MSAGLSASPEVGAGTVYLLGFDLLLEEAETDLHSQGGKEKL